MFRGVSGWVNEIRLNPHYKIVETRTLGIALAMTSNPDKMYWMVYVNYAWDYETSAYFIFINSLFIPSWDAG